MDTKGPLAEEDPMWLFVFGSVFEARAADVVWETEDIDLEIADGVAVDFKLDYTVDLTGATRSMPLSLRTCEMPASGDPFCYTTSVQVPAEDGPASVRYGVDASQYELGTNVYTLTLVLGRRVASDVLTIVVEVVE